LYLICFLEYLVPLVLRIHTSNPELTNKKVGEFYLLITKLSEESKIPGSIRIDYL